MNNLQVLYGLDDITIVPAVQSNIRHRRKCHTSYDDNNILPIFVAPMDTVVNSKNVVEYEKNNVIPILPRTETISTRLSNIVFGRWCAFSLEEFNTYFIESYEHTYSKLIDKPHNKEFIYHVLIDIANGHIDILTNYIKDAKRLLHEFNLKNNTKYYIEIMVGNIANPETYKVLAEAGADYVRVGIGSGGCCITSSNTAIHYPMASLLMECANYRKEYNLNTKIICDGGISNYNRAIKAFACGADYVMIGSLFGRCFESAGDIINADIPHAEMVKGLSIKDINNVKDGLIEFDSEEELEKEKRYYIGMNLKKVIYGMSTKRAQININKAKGFKADKLKTSEGVEKTIKVEYTLKQWLENFVDYLRSSMSYCNCEFLHEFTHGKPTLAIMSPVAQLAFNK